MGVDYSGVGGVGIPISEPMLNQLMVKYGEPYPCEALEHCKIPYAQAGDGCYGGEYRWYFVMPYKSFTTCVENAQVFIDSINLELGTSVVVEDLEVIADIHIW